MNVAVWDEFLKILKDEVGTGVVETWFKAVLWQRWDSYHKIVYLKAPNSFIREWIKNNYLSLVQTHLGRLLHVDMPTVVFVDGEQQQKMSMPEVTSQVAVPIQAAQSNALIRVNPATRAVTTTQEHDFKTSSYKNSGHLNKSYVFENFVVGSHNALAYAAAQAVAERPGKVYNPMFIYGGSGLGKTHLLHAIGNAIRIKEKKAQVLYQTTDRFVSEFINAIRFDKVHKFQIKYREIDVLLIDDVQFISNKEQTQEAFFHIFNALYDSQKQIVFSSDTYPSDIDGMAERLRSRLEWGLLTDIQVPTLETKIAILKKKAEMHNEMLDDEVANFIAQRTATNIRELEGSLIRVMAFASLTKHPVSLELARKVLIRIDEPQGTGAVDLDRVVRCVGKHYSYTSGDLKSKSRNKDLSFARQVAMFLMKKMTDRSLRDIGFYLGGKDHSTVMHALKKIQLHVTDNEVFAAQLKQIESEISSRGM
jgi:chromosomal replication initiator protein